MRIHLVHSKCPSRNHRMSILMKIPSGVKARMARYATLNHPRLDSNAVTFPGDTCSTHTKHFGSFLQVGLGEICTDRTYDSSTREKVNRRQGLRLSLSLSLIISQFRLSPDSRLQIHAWPATNFCRALRHQTSRQVDRHTFCCMEKCLP